MHETQELEKLVRMVLASPKYRHVSQELIRRIGARELAFQRSSREAIKATKNKLHQIGGAYFQGRVDWQRHLDLIRLASESGDENVYRQACRNAMRWHTSTRERLPILDDFFVTTLGDLLPLRTVIDVACGLNPLARPWMPLADQVTYYAYDVYADMVAFLRGFMDIIGLKGQAEVRDVLHDPPSQETDLALILKSLPCLEQLDRAAVPRLLETINARYMLVSFPVRSLGGRGKGMAGNYEASFRALLAGRNWSVRRFEFATELAFLVEKR